MGKRYDKEFKIEAVRLASEPSNSQSQTQRDLGMGQGMISRWKGELRLGGGMPFPEKAISNPRMKNCATLDVRSTSFVGSETF